MENSKIEWTDHTFNPWIGCTKVSDGCKFCYAESLMDHRYHKVRWGLTGTRHRTNAATWLSPVHWNKQAKVAGVRQKVFCASLADVFEDRPELEEWRADLFKLIGQTPDLDWLLLTKRPEKAKEYQRTVLGGKSFPFNAWLGTSVENQEQADKRIPILLETPAVIRFLSMEPLLGPVDLGLPFASDNPYMTLAHVDWVIVGGESGQKCRPMQIEWAQDIQQQCEKSCTAFFMKQLGGHPDKRHNLEQFPPELRVRQFPG